MIGLEGNSQPTFATEDTASSQPRVLPGLSTAQLTGNAPTRRNIHTFMGLGPKVSLKETVATHLTEQQTELFDVPLRQLGVYDEATAHFYKRSEGTKGVDLGLATHDAANALGHMAEVLIRSGHSPTEAPLTVINGLLRPPPSVNDQP